jgi:glycosyltransferase involved in cell wall biosynthesis
MNRELLLRMDRTTVGNLEVIVDAPRSTDAPVTIVPQGQAAPDRCGNRMRILMIVECSAGGTGRHVLDLAEGLIDRNCEVHLIYSTGRIDKMFRDRMAEVPSLQSQPIVMRTTPHPADFGVVKAIKRYIRASGPFDAIHGHSSKGGAIARLAAFGTGIPAYYTLHGLIMMDPGLARWKRLFYLTIEKILSWRTARIIAVSPEEARAAIQVGLGAQRIILIPNGVGPAVLSPRNAARKALGLADDQMAIGFVGRLVDQKAPHVLIESFAATVKLADRARLVIVGDGPLMKPMQELGARLGVADKILWLGERDAREVLAAFDVFAMSSRKEGLPYVILEAMAAGLPIVATVSSGVEILIEPGINGFVVPTDDIAAFSAALIALASDPDRMIRYGAASLRRAAELSIDAMVEQTLVAYQSSRVK